MWQQMCLPSVNWHATKPAGWRPRDSARVAAITQVRRVGIDLLHRKYVPV